MTHVFKFLERNAAADLLMNGWMEELELSSWPVSSLPVPFALQPRSLPIPVGGAKVFCAPADTVEA